MPYFNQDPPSWYYYAAPLGSSCRYSSGYTISHEFHLENGILTYKVINEKYVNYTNSVGPNNIVD